MLSALVGKFREAGAERHLVLQHRDELVTQNRKTFHAVNRSVPRTGVIDANNKDFHQHIVFGMVPTVARNLKHLRATDLVVVDEAHHTAATSYGKILKHLYEMNPEMKLAGFTATSQRGDKKPLREFYDNVSDQITVLELIRAGILVTPRFFVVDIGVQEDLQNVRKLASDFDMSEVARIMDQRPLNKQVVDKWKDQAGDRQTVVFCSTVEHATHITEEFQQSGVGARMVWGDMGAAARRQTLQAYDRGAFQVLVNVAVLTEGWDCQPVSCVVLLRPCSFKSTMIQMVGRGLRRLDPDLHPGRTKSDCIVLDFGTSVLTHGTIEMDVELDPKKGAAPVKTCPECEGEVPMFASECPLCGHVFESEEESDGDGSPLEPGEIGEFVLREIDIFNASPFKWEEFMEGAVLIANGFQAWAMVIWFQGQWYAFGMSKGEPLKHVSNGDKMVCLSSADDFIRLYEEEDSAHKSRRWIRKPATARQLQLLGLPDIAATEINRYRASCSLTWKFNERYIQPALMGRMAA